MEDKWKLRSKWGKWLLVLSALLFGFVELTRLCINHPRINAILVQHSVSKIEKDIQTLIDNNADYHQFNKAEVGLFVYHNDSLLYWNSNQVGSKLIRRKVELGSDTICNLLTGDYYVKSFRKGILDYYAFKLVNTTYHLENQYFENRYQPLNKILACKVSFGDKQGFEVYSKSGKTLSRCQIVPKKRQFSIYWQLFYGLVLLMGIAGLVLLLSKPEVSSTRSSKFKVEYGIAIILILALVCTYLHYEFSTRRENKEMMDLAGRLMEKRDAAFEESFERFAQEIQNDSALHDMVFAESNVLSDVVLGYSQELLFDAAMKEYTTSLTVCMPEEEIAVQPDNYITNCDDYFIEMLARNPHKRVKDNLHFIDYNTLDPYYLGIVKIKSSDTTRQKTLYFEFYKPIAPEGFGFPQLLQEKNSQKPYAYSVANYRDDILVYKYGKYIYPNFFKDQHGKNNAFNTDQGYKHYTARYGDNNALVISVQSKDFAEKTAPFAVFFLGLLIPYLLVYFLVRPRPSKNSRNIRQRLQTVVFLTLALSFLAIGPVSVVYMQSVYNQKTMAAQYETTRTLSIELRNDLDLEQMLASASRDAWTEVLQHYAFTFFTDLNLYRLDGSLLATTRQEIYELNLQAPLMNAEAYQQIHRNKALFYTHEEHLGEGKYQSAYIPLTNNNGNTLAYLNTPYFSSATDLQKETRNFILIYINIILVFLGIALFFILRVTKRLTQPLALIQNKMAFIEVDQKNEPIEWEVDDEIGALVKQYNQLINKLEISVAELKRTTTESAWRGVARQVAHEIKNSLTPMRLSVQLLQRNIDNGKATPEQIQRTTNTLIEQIDALSDIASSFSTYAKLPENHPAPLDLAELVGNVVNLYDNVDNIAFCYNYDASQDHTFNGDKTNLNSAVGNLVKNAVQAIGSKPEGKIDVTLKSTPTAFIVSVKDNGKGIKEEDKSQIFLPNFTTKTGGSGVGLSLTYNIVQAAGGTISFESTEGEGATFTIELPKTK